MKIKELIDNGELAIATVFALRSDERKTHLTTILNKYLEKGLLDKARKTAELILQ
jgi:hypothetical protein